MPIEPGALFIVRPDVAHSFTTNGSAPLHMLNIHFDLIERPDSEKINYGRPFGARNPRRRLEILPDIAVVPGFLPPRMKIDQVAGYERLFHATLRLFGPGDVASRMGLKAAFLELLAFLFRQSRAQAVSPRLLRHLPQLERAVDFMGETLHRPLELAEIARTVGLSRSYFATCFHDYYDLSPAKYHLHQRIEKAATMLTFGSSVKEASASFGFQTVHHFSRCFRRIMGLPPATYQLVHGVGIPDESKTLKTNRQKKRKRGQRHS